MNWETDLRAADLGDDVKLELTCNCCVAVRFIAPEVILACKGGKHLYLDQVEAKARCAQRGVMASSAWPSSARARLVVLSAESHNQGMARAPNPKGPLFLKQYRSKLAILEEQHCVKVSTCLSTEVRRSDALNR